ncbi:MAG TPA: pyridoxal phosphate-dependent aminotransferase [Firmicutes bacterium]|nr:pyridoxal phosphate-dependent aminotransferase [Bacillota bacterium]
MPSERSHKMPPFIVMDVMERAKELENEGHSIIHLEVGEPDFDTPAPIREAAQRALMGGETHYTHSLGLLELREAIARHYLARYGVDVSPDQIIVTSGTSPALFLVFEVLLNPGDEVILSDPGYSCYRNVINYVGGVSVPVKVFESDGFRYRASDVRAAITPRTKAIMINSPSNPTGTVLPPADLEAIAALGLPVVSDEIYHGLVYGEKEHSILEFTDLAFVINGFSKLFAMTGWRLGYVIAPPDFIRPMQRLQQNLFICASAFSQRAAIAAFSECAEYTRKMVNTYDRRRRHIIRRLREIGFGVTVEPRGAFYVLANAQHICRDSYKLAFEILEKAHVAVAPGIDFGENAEGYLRFSYANSIENIEEGMRRIEAFIRARG